MHHSPPPAPHGRAGRAGRSGSLHGAAALALLAVLACLVTACGGRSGSATTVALDAPVSSTVPSDTTLTVGDPVTQVALQTSGLIDQIPFTIKFANLSGGPQTMEAFRGHALDLGSVADIPPVFAHWTGLDTHIVAAKFRRDPVHHPIYELGVAPGAGITKLSDIKGKKVAFSPGQAQGALVLRLLQKLDLSQDDVQLVEIPSTEDVYNNALAAHQVDVAPLGGVYIKRYLADYGAKGGTVLETGIRDDASFLYAPDTVLADPAKAAAIKSYVTYWARAQRWIQDHPQEWLKAYYEDNQGLDAADGKWLIRNAGDPVVPTSWTRAIAQHQQTIDLLSAEEKQPDLKASDLWDRRFEHVAGRAYAASGGAQ
jgi:sulfonate transport system substrate-binding protein